MSVTQREIGLDQAMIGSVALGQQADWRDYLALLKPRVMSLVVFTGLVGMIAAPANLHPVLAFTAILSLAVGAGAAGAINMWYDADIDAAMHRTATRPIPAGRIAPGEALGFAVVLAVASVAMMGLNVNWLAAGILAFSIVFYGVLYTMGLKRRTSQNIVIGGAAGAFPPLIGWVAATGEITTMPVILFLIIFLWTPPHFWALSLLMASEYTKAGVPMLPVVAGPAATKRQILYYTVAMVATSLAPTLLGFASWIYGAVAVVLGGVFIFYALRLQRRERPGDARGLFGYSILYLFLLFAAYAGDVVLARQVMGG